jgi:hypothetical protein
VKLKNPESGRQVSGLVTGPNTAKGIWNPKNVFFWIKNRK